MNILLNNELALIIRKIILTYIIQIKYKCYIFSLFVFFFFAYLVFAIQSIDIYKIYTDLKIIWISQKCIKAFNVFTIKHNIKLFITPFLILVKSSAFVCIRLLYRNFAHIIAKDHRDRWTNYPFYQILIDR